MSDTAKPDFAAEVLALRIEPPCASADGSIPQMVMPQWAAYNLARAYFARTTVTEGMCKAAARELAAQMGEPLIEDAWTDEDTKDWTHILTAALEAR